MSPVTSNPATKPTPNPGVNPTANPIPAPSSSAPSSAPGSATPSPTTTPAATTASIEGSLGTSSPIGANLASHRGPPGASALRPESLLPGGCPLWVVRRPGPEIVSAKLWIRGGSSSDPSGQRGCHQLLAGLLSRGCGDHSGEALADQVEGLGAGLRCEASEDGLLISLKCAAADAKELLPLLLTLVQKPWLLSDQIDLERQLNLQALQRHREDPFQLAHDRLRQQLYGDGPYGHDPLGVETERASIGRDVLSDQAALLGRAGAVLVLAGQPPANLEALLTQDCGPQGWPTQAPLPNPTWTPTSQPIGQPAGAANRLASSEEDTEQLVLMLGATTVPLGHRHGLALRLLHCHLGVGMSSRLFVTMREEHGLAYDVGVHHPARLGAAPFMFHLSSSAERAFEATTELLNEWQRLLDQPLSQGDLALARAKFRGQEAMGRQTGSQVADRLALVLGHGLPADFTSRCLGELDGLEPADLLGAARELLARPSLSLCGPAQALGEAEKAWSQHRLSA